MARPNRLLLLLTALLIGSVTVLAGPVPLSGQAAPQEPAPAGHIVISEFRARGPTGADDEFIELYNPTAFPIDISHWQIRSSNAAGGINVLAQVPAGVSLDPGQYYLITNAAGYSGTTSANLTYPGVAPAIANDGGIAIFDDADLTIAVDQVGMNIANEYYEGTPLNPLTGNQNRGYERFDPIEGNCVDDEDNVADFQLKDPSDPQNMAETRNLCGTVVVGTSITIDADAPATTIVGEDVTVRFTVRAASGTDSPTGRVSVTDGKDVCKHLISASGPGESTGKCVFPLTTAGTRNLVATYLGDDKFDSSVSAAEPHKVVKADTTISITSHNPKTTAAGQAFNVRWNLSVVAPAGGTPGGNVTVTDGTNICTAAAATGQCSLTLFTVGTRTITAKYPGDANYNPSTSAGVKHNVTTAPTSTPAGFNVIINEVAWSGTAASGADEWIELYNPTDSPVDLSGWRLRAADLNPNIALEGVIPAKGYYLLERENENTVSDIDADLVYTVSPLSNELSDTGEKLYLYRGFSIIDYANTLSNTWLAGSVTNHRSMERRGLVIDSRTAWVTNTGVVRNGRDAQGNPINGTPKNRNWAFTVTLTPSPRATIIPTRTKPPVARPVLNEFLVRAGFDWNRDGRIDVFDEFIEIANLGPVDWNTSGWKIDDEANGGSPPFAIPQMTLKPGERAVFYGFQTNIRLSDGGDTVRLLNQSNVVYDSQTYPVIKASDESWCRLPDIRGSWYPDCFPTPNFPNERQGQVPSMPPGTGLEEPLCTLADTLPEEFILAECRAYGENMWSTWYWNLQGGMGQILVDQNGSKWEVWVE